MTKPARKSRRHVASEVRARSRSDIFSPEKRSEVMARIKGKHTRPELAVRSLLHAMGFRFRLHRRDLPGKPDIVLPRFGTAIFVNGCFWHLHEDCSGGRLPTSNRDFWKRKLMGNRERDKQKVSALRAAGWRVIVLWECEVEKAIGMVEQRLRSALGSQ
jgi:DNA mismatch endonuclease, patch repair protein